MSTFTEILNAAMTLPPGERSELAAVLQESVAEAHTPASAPQLSEAWREEIARRSAESAAYVDLARRKLLAVRGLGRTLWPQTAGAGALEKWATRY